MHSMKTSLENIVLVEAVRARASDVHIDPLIEGFTIRFRIDGNLVLWKTVDREAGEKLVNQIKAEAGIETGSVYHPVGERLRRDVDGEEVDFRISLVPCISGPKMAVRILDPRQAKLGLPMLGLTESQTRDFNRWLNELNGMILVTGPTACGKTTTLYALLHEMVEDSRHVVTIEDPVEYQLDGINQIEVDERHGLDFAEGVRTSLRLDPDCLMVGEIREEEVANQAITASIQGHIVMSTLHSRDAISAITRLRNFGVADHQIATSVGVVVNQRLIRLLCKNCSSTRSPSDIEKSYLKSLGRDDCKEIPYSTGCDQCRETGFKGRTGLFEVWNLDHTDYEMILAGADEDTIRTRQQRAGSDQLMDHAFALINDGTVSLREIMHLGISLPWEIE